MAEDPKLLVSPSLADKAYKILFSDANDIEKYVVRYDYLTDNDAWFIYPKETKKKDPIEEAIDKAVRELKGESC